MQSIVKVVWDRRDDGRWRASLLTAGRQGFSRKELIPGKSTTFEVLNERRCIGYSIDIGERTPCPDFNVIEKGSRCPHCRSQDIYTDFVQGTGELEIDAEFSVYLAQCGSQVKVGVTRSDRREQRWIEQGADRAVVIASGLSARDALDREDRLSDQGISQRIRKERKVEDAASLLEERLAELDVDAEIREIHGMTDYPELTCTSMERFGRFNGPVKTVKGQIVSNGDLCMALSSGKVIQDPEQRGLEEF
jgi:hypothetical protein